MMINETLDVLSSISAVEYLLIFLVLNIFGVISYIVYAWLWAAEGKRVAIPVSLLLMLSFTSVFVGTIINSVS